MLSRASVFASCLAVGFMALSGTTLFPQTPAGEVSAGWAFLHRLDAADEGERFFASFPIGLHLGCGVRITDSVGIVGDFGWNRKLHDGDALALRARDDTVARDRISSQAFTTFAGGPRLYFGDRSFVHDRVTVFVHALFGASRNSTTVIREVRGSEATFFESAEIRYVYRQTVFMVQPGGGVDLPLGDAAAVRVQFDCQWRLGTLETNEINLRFMIGGVIYLGER
jgi:hypothetical protein